MAPEGLAGQSGYDILRCSCSRYPVVAGIPLLLKSPLGPAGPTADEILVLLEAGHPREALLRLLAPPSPTLAPAWMKALPSLRGVGRLRRLAHARALDTWRQQADELLMSTRGPTTTCERLAFYLRSAGQLQFYPYWAFRSGQPRHLVALAFASLIDRPSKPLLDLACGYGHLTRHLVQRAQGQLVVGVDTAFFALYVAKHWIAPEAQYVCCAADLGLPFRDSSFSTAFCSDAFHYFERKVTCMRELLRVTDDEGLILLVWLHNALVKPASGILRPLSPAGYRTLVANLPPHRVVADREVLLQYLRRQGPRLSRAAADTDLAHQPRLSLVVSRRREVFRDYGPFNEWPHGEGQLQLNPLYVIERRDGNVRLRRTFPSARFETEHAWCKEYLAETVEISAEAWAALVHGKRTPAVETLVARNVVLGMPEQFGDPWASLARE